MLHILNGSTHTRYQTQSEYICHMHRVVLQRISCVCVCIWRCVCVSVKMDNCVMCMYMVWLCGSQHKNNIGWQLRALPPYGMAHSFTVRCSWWFFIDIVCVWYTYRTVWHVCVNVYMYVVQEHMSVWALMFWIHGLCVLGLLTLSCWLCHYHSVDSKRPLSMSSIVLLLIFRNIVGLPFSYVYGNNIFSFEFYSRRIRNLNEKYGNQYFVLFNAWALTRLETMKTCYSAYKKTANLNYWIF